MTIEEYKKDYPVIYQKAFDIFAKNARYYPPQTYIILENGGMPDLCNISEPHFSAIDPAELLKKFMKHRTKLLAALRNEKPNHIPR